MPDNELINSSNPTLEFKHIKIENIDKVDDYLFITLDNGQKILTNGIELYDVSDYSDLTSIFNMGDKFCAVFIKKFSPVVVDLKTMEVLYKDKNAYAVSKQDEKTLYIEMKVGCGNYAIYNIETKKYLVDPTEFIFERSLGNNLYIFREKRNSNKNFFEYKRCVINSNGEKLLEDVEGYIYFSGNHLINIKEKEINIISGINDGSIIEMKTITRNEKMIAKPEFYDGNIVIIQKGTIKICTPNLELINEFKIDDLEEISSYEIMSSILKIYLSLTVDGKPVNKHLFVDLKTGNSISHINMKSYPYETPTTYVGYDRNDSELTDYHFYNANFESIVKISANSYECVDNQKECMFVIRKKEVEGEKRQLLNTENGSIRQIDYEYVNFHLSLPYGYGVNPSDKTLDFFDRNLNVIIPRFDYKKFNLKLGEYGFDYLIVNNYVCIINHFVAGDTRSRWRYIIQNSNGDIVLDSIEHRCYAMGNIIKIIGPDSIQFLNTKTGKIGNLNLVAPVDEKGNINFNEIKDINKLLIAGNNFQLLLPPGDGSSNPIPKRKKLKPNI